METALASSIPPRARSANSQFRRRPPNRRKSRRAPAASSGSHKGAMSPIGPQDPHPASPPEIGAIDPTTHAITEVALPAGYAAPTSIVAGPDGNLWFADTSTDGLTAEIGRLNPATNVITEFALGAEQQYEIQGPSNSERTATSGSHGRSPTSMSSATSIRQPVP